MSAETRAFLHGASAQDLLGRMLLIRRFDERLLTLQKEGLVPGHTSPYIGQEAVAVGVAAELAAGDIVASHHRPTGHALAAGLDPGRLLAELLGRSGGYCRGKAGKHQVSALEHGFLGANGVVGGGIPLAVGAALSQTLRRSGGVTIAYFGDGDRLRTITPGLLAHAARIVTNSRESLTSWGLKDSGRRISSFPEIVAAGRREPAEPDEIVLYDTGGLAVADLAYAALLWRRLKEKNVVGA